MSRDELAVCLLIGSFVSWALVHLFVVTRLAGRRPWWRGPVALVVLPLAPYWAAKAGLRAWASIWVLALAAWLTSRALLSS